MKTTIEELERTGWKNAYYKNKIIYLNMISPNCINSGYKYIYYEENDGILYKKLDNESNLKNYMHDEKTITLETLDDILSNPIKQLRNNIKNTIFKDYDLVSFGADEKLKDDLINVHSKIDNDLHFTEAKSSDFNTSVKAVFDLVNDFMRLVNIKNLGEHKLGWIKLDEKINSTSNITILEALRNQGYGLYWPNSEIYFFYECPENSYSAYPGNPTFFGMCECDDGYTKYKGNGENLCITANPTPAPGTPAPGTPAPASSAQCISGSKKGEPCTSEADCDNDASGVYLCQITSTPSTPRPTPVPGCASTTPTPAPGSRECIRGPKEGQSCTSEADCGNDVSGVILCQLNSTPAPGTPTPGPGTPTPGPGTPTPGPGTPTPAPGTPTPGPGTPTPAPGTPTPAPSTPTPGPGTPTPAPSTPTPAPGTPTPAPGTPTPAPSTPTPGLGTPTPGPGTPTLSPPPIISGCGGPFCVNDNHNNHVRGADRTIVADTREDCTVNYPDYKEQPYKNAGDYSIGCFNCNTVPDWPGWDAVTLETQPIPYKCLQTACSIESFKIPTGWDYKCSSLIPTSSLDSKCNHYKPCADDNICDNRCYAKQEEYGEMVCPEGTREIIYDPKFIVPYTTFTIPQNFRRTWKICI